MSGCQRALSGLKDGLFNRWWPHHDKARHVLGSVSEGQRCLCIQSLAKGLPSSCKHHDARPGHPTGGYGRLLRARIAETSVQAPLQEATAADGEK